MMLQNYAWVRDKLKVYDKTIDFSCQKNEKFIDTFSDSTMRLIFKTLSLFKFYVASKKMSTII